MPGTDDKLAAVKDVEQRVLGSLNVGRTPRRLLEELFKDLRSGINKGDSSGAALTREEAAKRVGKLQKESPFKTAVAKTLPDAMQCVSDSDAPVEYQHPGIACVKATVDAWPHWVVVRGPCASHRDVPEDNVLKLTVDFRPIGSPRIQKTRARYQLDGRPTDPPTQFPDRLQPYLENAAEHLSEAMNRFNENERLRELMWDHAISLAENFRSEFEKLRVGEIRTDYDEVKLLTACVEKLSEGEELLGLTDWATDAPWWQEDEASRFLDANAKAINHKASVRRIFVHSAFETDAERARRIKEMDRHVRLGVKVKFIASDNLPETMPELASQCVIRSNGATAHGWLTYRVELAHGKRPLRNVFSIDPKEIRANEQLLLSLWQSATKHS